MTPSCADCRFWRELVAGQIPDGGYEITVDGSGLCRRLPPGRGGNHEDSSDAANAAAWPVTWAEDWCGEHIAGQLVA